MCGLISAEISNAEIHEHPSGGDKLFRREGEGRVVKKRDIHETVVSLGS